MPLRQDQPLATVWHGPSALAVVRSIAGDQDPLRALPGTVRGDLSPADTADPLVELSKDAADTARLKGVWFEEADLALAQNYIRENSFNDEVVAVWRVPEEQVERGALFKRDIAAGLPSETETT